MMKIISKRDRMVGMKSMLSSPFVSSQRPYTELAAASTEQREFRVVVMPAWEESHVLACLQHSDCILLSLNAQRGDTLAMEMVCCSMASWIATLSSSLIWTTNTVLSLIMRPEIN